MKITIEHKTEIMDGKGYLLTITRIRGFQQVQRHGETKWVSAITYQDGGPRGVQPSYTLYKGPIPPEGEAPDRLPPSVEARVKEIAAQILWSKGGIA